MPKIGGKVKSPDGEAIVVSCDMLKMLCKVKIANPDGSETYKDFPVDRLDFKRGQKADEQEEETIESEMKEILD